MPLLREGVPEAALPPLLCGRVYAELEENARYFASLFRLVRTRYGVPAEAVSHCRLISNLMPPMHVLRVLLAQEQVRAWPVDNLRYETGVTAGPASERRG